MNVGNELRSLPIYSCESPDPESKAAATFWIVLDVSEQCSTFKL